MPDRAFSPQDGPQSSRFGDCAVTDSSQGPKPFENFVTTNSKMVPFNAWSLAEASMLAYEKAEETIECVLKNHWGFDDVKTFGYKNDTSVQFKLTQVFVAWNDDIILVCFRGTETFSRRDWLNNTKVSLVKGGPFGTSIHRGFKAALDEDCDDTTILEKVMSEVKALSGKQRALYLTGHSLGAALATLTAAYLLDQKVNLTGLYTYGSPRVGGVAFAAEFNERAKALTHRFVNRQDGVARLPLEALGYQHVGEMWHMTEEGVTLRPDGQQAWDVFGFNLDGQLDAGADHNLRDGYLPNLLSWRSELTE